MQALSFSVKELTHANKKDRITADRIFTGFVRYVMTDELNKDGKGACGSRLDAAVFDSSLVADPIDHITKELLLSAHTTQGGWVRVWVPQDVTPGVYNGTVVVNDGATELGTLDLRVNVKDRTLPTPADWKFHLDLWQNPFAIARYHQVEPWSEEHFKIMRPYMELYRDAGGKVITTSIMHKPWNGQTYDYFETMVTWMKKADGTWSFDYTVFDRWVEFMLGLGISKEINCYSMIPWRPSFQYFGQATNQLREVNTKPGEPASDEMIQKRRSEGKVTTFYTSCEEPHPNTFTFNPPAECEWFGWYVAKAGLDGYLRWAYNSWVIEPLVDSRFYTWAGGDTYFVYPGARTSLRFERLVSGAQAFEKVRVLREEFVRTNNRSALKKIEKALEAFDETTLDRIPASEVINRANRVIDSF